ncbi:hypothetical protein [Limnoglobus roseus]|uniref:Alpha/beta hydrolase n=1 Tax=Limnoglobus roseus TaxID=2598579 RepID=A0A5C1AEB7_9BACT|nr:hypothetical protein [Limnoglobus roseus]QEL17729.1 alpha/beta hydrolase [Limnoglobus roseus]
MAQIRASGALPDPNRWEHRLPEMHIDTVASYARLKGEADLLHANLIREIVPNPFRPPAFLPEWQTRHGRPRVQGSQETRTSNEDVFVEMARVVRDWAASVQKA